MISRSKPQVLSCAKASASKAKNMNYQDTQVLVVRMSRLVEMIGLSRSTIWKLLSEDQFPNPIRLGSRSIAWRVKDVEEWLQSREELVTYRRK